MLALNLSLMAVLSDAIKRTMLIFDKACPVLVFGCQSIKYLAAIFFINNNGIMYRSLMQHVTQSGSLFVQ